MSRQVAGLAALLVVLVACSPSTGAADVENSAVRIARLRAAVGDVADAQQTADDLLGQLVTSVRDLEATVVQLRSADSIAAGIDGWEQVALDWPAAGSPPVREALREVAVTVDDARLVLARVREIRTGAWEQAYLEAQDEVLSSVRTYAAAADRLSQAVEQHWDHLVLVHDIVDSFVDRRWFFRSDTEATQAFEVEVADHVSNLDDAATDIGVIARERESAAAAVNAASLVAQDLWRQRPSTPAPSG